MITNNTKLKEIPKDTKFASFISDNEDIILGEYLIATLIYNGATFHQLLECANHIEVKKERENIKAIITEIVLNFINLNPKFDELLRQNETDDEF